MAHSKITDFQVRHISTVGRRRGPKPKLLPGDRIRELHHDGLGVERIAQELKAEGVNVSPRTVLRVVRGERHQPEEQIPLRIP